MISPRRDSRDLRQLLANRKMCRDFTRTAVSESALSDVLAAAMGAPAAGNTWALDLVVLKGESETSQYWDVSLPAAKRSTFPWPGLLNAQVLVLPYVEPDAYVRRYAESDKAHTRLGGDEAAWPVPYWWVDGGAALMSVLVAAENAELGALLFGQFEHEPALARRFGVPGGRRALGTIALGHPAPGDRSASHSGERGRPALADRLHRGRW